MHAVRAMTSALARLCWFCAAQAMTGLLAVLLLVSLLYATTSLYVFAVSQPFVGPGWYNPYGDLPAAGRWQKANFHAHSIAWGGLTNGGQSAQDVVSAYAGMRYDIVGVSNYHSLSASEVTGTFPVYEQGWNVQKSHRLAIGGDKVVWRDYPLGQTAHQQQDIINRIRATGAVVALAHPAIRDGHSLADLRRLSGYDALEVLNHFVAPATAQWDAALSAGRAVWVLANDDSHDIHGAGETGVNWTLVHTPSSAAADVRSAIRAGRTIGVRGQRGQAHLQFLSQYITGDTLEVRVRGPVGRVTISGQDGVARNTVITDSAGIIIARAIARSDDGYLRTTVEGDSTSEGELLLLNPVVRWDGQALGAALATVDTSRTSALRWIAFCLYGAAFTSIRARQPRRVPRARPILT